LEQSVAIVVINLFVKHFEVGKKNDGVVYDKSGDDDTGEVR